MDLMEGLQYKCPKIMIHHKTSEIYHPRCFNVISGFRQHEVYVPVDAHMDMMRDIFNRIRKTEFNNEDTALILDKICIDICSDLKHLQELKDLKDSFTDAYEDHYDDDDLNEFCKDLFCYDGED